jgi:ribose transport system ATP-binding protein
MTETAKNVPVFECREISKSFSGVTVLQDIALSVGREEVLGLVGENGAGKSTLMNILGGVLRPDSGTMHLEGEIYQPHEANDALQSGIAFVHQAPNLFLNLSIADNLFLNDFPVRRFGGIPCIDKKASRARAAALLAELDLQLSPDTLIEDVSPGERQLVEIAKALHVRAKLVIFDEPTTSLTATETRRLFRVIEGLGSGGTAVIYISHTLEEVLALADQIVVLRDGVVVESGEKKKFTLDSLVTLMVGREMRELYPAGTTNPTKKHVLEVRGVTQPGVVENISFELHGGEVLGVAGLVGAGRSELARILFGLDRCREGEIRINGQVAKEKSAAEHIRMGMAFLTEDRREDGLMMENSVVENLGMVVLRQSSTFGAPLVKRQRIVQRAREVASLVALNTAALGKSAAKQLSGGNQQKVVFGKWLMEPPSVFLLDEPTRGIDVGAKYEIYQVIKDLAARGAGILVISSQIEELIGICDRILVMCRGEIRAEVAKNAFDREAILRLSIPGAVT